MQKPFKFLMSRNLSSRKLTKLFLSSLCLTCLYTGCTSSPDPSDKQQINSQSTDTASSENSDSEKESSDSADSHQENTPAPSDETDAGPSDSDTSAQNDSSISFDPETLTAAQVQDSLKKLSSSSSVQQVRNALNMLLGWSAASMDYCFHMAEDSAIDSVATDKDNVFYVKSQNLQNQKTFLLEEDVLNEVVCNQAVANKTPYIGLVQLSQNMTRMANLKLDQPDTVFDPNPIVTLNMYMANPADENQAAAQNFHSALISEEINALLPLMGRDLPIQFYDDPSLYDFHLDQTDSGYLFTIVPADQDAYNRKLDEQAKTDRTDLFETGNYIADDFVTETAEVTLVLDSDFVLQRATVTTQNTFTYQSQEYQTGVNRNWTLTDGTANAQQQSSYLDDLFGQFEDGTIQNGDSFTLEIDS